MLLQPSEASPGTGTLSSPFKSRDLNSKLASVQSGELLSSTGLDTASGSGHHSHLRPQESDLPISDTAVLVWPISDPNWLGQLKLECSSIGDVQMVFI